MGTSKLATLTVMAADAIWPVQVDRKDGDSEKKLGSCSRPIASVVGWCAEPAKSEKREEEDIPVRPLVCHLILPRQPVSHAREGPMHTHSQVKPQATA